MPCYEKKNLEALFVGLYFVQTVFLYDLIIETNENYTIFKFLYRFVWARIYYILKEEINKIT